MWAAAHNNKEAIKLILGHISKFDIDIQLQIINAKDNYGNTTLIEAAFAGHKKAIKLILSHISKFDINVQLQIINAKDNDGITALDLAVYYLDWAVAKLLRKATHKINEEITWERYRALICENGNEI